MKRTVVLALGLLATPGAAEPGASGGAPGTVRTVEEIHEALKASKLTYTLKDLADLEDSPVAGFASVLWPEARSTVGRVRIVRNPDGSSRVTAAVTDPTVWAALQKGEERFQADDFAAALEQWKPVVAAYPDEPVVQLHVGDAWFFLRRYDLALEHYERAVALLPLDYQANLFRAHALYRLGRKSESLDAFARSLACRPRHGSTLEILGRYANDLGIRVVAEGLPPRALVRREGDEIALYIPDAPWTGWALCKAAWLGEPQFRASAGVEPGVWSSTEERECLLNLLGVYIGMRNEGSQPEDEALERLRKVHAAGLLDALALYEFGSRVWPDVIVAQDEPTRAAVERYVREFLLAPVEAQSVKP